MLSALIHTFLFFHRIRHVQVFLFSEKSLLNLFRIISVKQCLNSVFSFFNCGSVLSRFSRVNLELTCNNAFKYRRGTSISLGEIFCNNFFSAVAKLLPSTPKSCRSKDFPSVRRHRRRLICDAITYLKQSISPLNQLFVLWECNLHQSGSYVYIAIAAI